MSNEENRERNEASANRPECSHSVLPTSTTPSVVRGPELIYDGDVDEPPDNAIRQLSALLETTKGTPSQSNGDNPRRPAGVEEIDDKEEPISERTVAESFDDSAISNKLRTPESNVNLISTNEAQDIENDEDSSPSPFQVAYYHTTDEESANAPPEAYNSNAIESPDEEEPSSNVTGNTADTETETYDDTPTDNPTSVMHIPEAFLVEQQDDLTVYDAVQV